MPPLQTNLVFVQRHRVEKEVLEERRHEPHRPPNQVVRGSVPLTKKVQKGSKIGAVGPQEAVVMYVRRLSHRRPWACVVKVIETPATEMFVDIARNPPLCRIADACLAIMSRDLPFEGLLVFCAAPEIDGLGFRIQSPSIRYGQSDSVLIGLHLE